MKKYTFPFGQKVKPVVQQDRTPKKVFILGVYASAVHARWIGDDGKTKVTALAVASEPYIFWRGDGVEDIVSSIKLPKGAGKLVPAAANLNGPSGNTLDDAFIAPLGLTREDCWLCDIYPHSCQNPQQAAAIEREYLPIMDEFNLPAPDMPPEPKASPGKERAKEILDELVESEADVIMLLGDLPIKWWLRNYKKRWNSLADFGTDKLSYGRRYDCVIENKSYQILPLVHPRQAGKLGAHSNKWAALHAGWIKRLSRG